MATVFLHEMTRPAFEENLATNPNAVAIIPVGAVEQHGPHIALGRDTFGATEVAREVAERTGSFVVLATWPGVSENHMGFTGTITLRPETLVNVMLDVVGSLGRHGIRRALLVNNHGGNKQALEYAALLCRRQAGVVTIVAAEAGKTMTAETNHRRKHMLDVHAGQGETGRMLAIRPDLVEMWRVQDWQPTMDLPDELLALLNPGPGIDPDVASQLLMAHLPPTHRFSSSGVYGFASPAEADAEVNKRELRARADLYVQLIELWKTIPVEALDLSGG